jgi:predicted RNA binding protein YcfA (HicA-like mRNA interferase family)
MSTPAGWLPLIKDWARLYQRLAKCSIVDIGHFCPICCLTNVDDFIKAIRKLGKAEGVEVRLEKRHGKGSHATLYYGDKKTTVKDRKKEVGPGLLNAMLKQLGLTKKDIE